MVGAIIRHVSVSMHDPAAIAAALRNARADIVVLIRGGGDAASFAVFEDPRVLDALASCRGYRVLGLGHTGDRTLAELACDHAASTPTAAGEHIRRGIEADYRMRSDAGRVREMQETLLRREMELAQAREALGSVSEPMPVEMKPSGPAVRKPTVPAWKWMLVGAAAGLSMSAAAGHWVGLF